MLLTMTVVRKLFETLHMVFLHLITEKNIHNIVVTLVVGCTLVFSILLFSLLVQAIPVHL